MKCSNYFFLAGRVDAFTGMARKVAGVATDVPRIGAGLLARSSTFTVMTRLDTLVSATRQRFATW